MNLPEVFNVLGLFTGVQLLRIFVLSAWVGEAFYCDHQVEARMQTRLHSGDILSEKFVITVLCLLAWTCYCFCWTPGRGRQTRRMFDL